MAPLPREKTNMDVDRKSARSWPKTWTPRAWSTMCGPHRELEHQQGKECTQSDRLDIFYHERALARNWGSPPGKWAVVTPTGTTRLVIEIDPHQRVFDIIIFSTSCCLHQTVLHPTFIVIDGTLHGLSLSLLFRRLHCHCHHLYVSFCITILARIDFDHSPSQFWRGSQPLTFLVGIALISF